MRFIIHPTSLCILFQTWFWSVISPESMNSLKERYTNPRDSECTSWRRISVHAASPIWIAIRKRSPVQNCKNILIITRRSQIIMHSHQWYKTLVSSRRGPPSEVANKVLDHRNSTDHRGGQPRQAMNYWLVGQLVVQDIPPDCQQDCGAYLKEKDMLLVLCRTCFKLVPF